MVNQESINKILEVYADEVKQKEIEYKLIYSFLQDLCLKLLPLKTYNYLIYGKNNVESFTFGQDTNEVLEQKHNKNGKQMSEELKERLNEWLLERL